MYHGFVWYLGVSGPKFGMNPYSETNSLGTLAGRDLPRILRHL